MFHTIEDFLSDWNNEVQSTQRILDALTDDSLHQAVSLDDRTLGRIAWHLVGTLHEMLSRTALTFDAPAEDAPVPDSAVEIATAYRTINEAMVNAIRTQWTDASLSETHNMYGEDWPNHVTLNVLIKHQIHHRGQMTVLMRQTDLPVPGIYGPSREEWSTFGAEAPNI
ncbi:MAG: DinB family protein [Gorillibacterium sp.]|nr:DinB family protein [Gorillibacterium sp.]